MAINRTSSPRPIDTLSPVYQQAAKDLLGPDIKQVTVETVSKKLKVLEGSDSASEILALKQLLQELVNPTPNVNPAGSAKTQGESEDPVVNPRRAEIQKKIDVFRSRLDKKVVGQPLFKDALARLLEKRLSERFKSPKPLALVLAGPSGVGKTSGAEELARILNDNPNAVVIRFNCEEIGTSYDLARWKGSAPGLVGYGADKMPVTAAKLAQAGENVVILVDEVSRAGRGLDPKAKLELQKRNLRLLRQLRRHGGIPSRQRGDRAGEGWRDHFHHERRLQ
jgi:ATP-dependent Clp protease ATP-binding subunit ClpA